MSSNTRELVDAIGTDAAVSWQTVWVTYLGRSTRRERETLTRVDGGGLTTCRFLGSHLVNARFRYS